MIVFLTLLLKIIPLYGMIILGFIASRILGVQKDHIAKLLIYIIAPVVIFYGTYSAELSITTLSLPILFFLLSSSIALVFWKIGGYIFHGSEKNVLAFTSGTGNTGYFGLPVISAVLGGEAFSIAVLCILGFVLYENTLGFYIVARANFSIKESIRKVLKLPTIYAFLLGVLLNIGGIEFGEIMSNTITQFKGVYTVLGMMIIGMGLAGANIKSFDIRFITMTTFVKFIIWPLLVAGIILLDQSILHFYPKSLYPVLIIMSIVPLAANTVALASELKASPEKAAIAVLVSTIIALFYIPLMVSIFF